MLYSFIHCVVKKNDELRRSKKVYLIEVQKGDGTIHDVPRRYSEFLDLDSAVQPLLFLVFSRRITCLMANLQVEGGATVLRSLALTVAAKVDLWVNAKYRGKLRDCFRGLLATFVDTACACIS